MRALTLRQPRAWAVIHAGKDIENRSWSTRIRGTLAIHAGMGFDGLEELPDRDPRPLRKTIPCKGKLGFWAVPPRVVRAIEAQGPRVEP